ncbi:MAG: histidine triad nucleotide-binding protein [Pseudomonadota bacterium]
MDCTFCKIRDGELPARMIYSDDQCFAFRDIDPQAPLHALVVPRRHISTLNDLVPDDEPLVGHLFSVAAKIARDDGHADEGWRAAFNVNRGAGQSVFHIHLHVLGGRRFRWPPG